MFITNHDKAFAMEVIQTDELEGVPNETHIPFVRMQ